MLTMAHMLCVPQEGPHGRSQRQSTTRRCYEARLVAGTSRGLPWSMARTCTFCGRW